MNEIQSTQMKLSEVMEYIGEYLRRNDFVIVPRAIAETEKLKEQYLRKTALTYKQIADSNMWGDIGKEQLKKGLSNILKEVKYFHMRLIKRDTLLGSEGKHLKG